MAGELLLRVMIVMVLFVVLVNQCGHWVQVEHRDMFNRTCIDFMKNG